MPDNKDDKKDAGLNDDDIITCSAKDLKDIVEDGLTRQAVAMQLTVDENTKAQFREIAEEVYNSDKANAIKTNKLSPRDDPAGGFKSFNHFVCDVIAHDSTQGRNTSKELAAWTEISEAREKAAGTPAQSAGSGELGGFLIPTEYRQTVLTRVRERLNILQKAQTIPMQTNTVEIPYLAGFNESDGKLFGNIEFIWPSEAEDRSAGKNVKLGVITLTLREASAMVYLNNSLIKFSPISIEPFITAGLDDAFDFTLSEKFIGGTGAGQPQGIMGSNCLVTVTKEGEQAADTIEIENILKMFSRHYGVNKEWYCNVDTLPQIATMVIAGGGSSTPVFMPMGGATGRPSDSLLGRPINWNDHAKTVGDAGDVILCDWSQYLVGQFQGDAGLEVAESIHLKFDYNQKALRFTFYIDGQPWWPSSFTPINSANTRSPFVVAENR